MSYQLPAFYFYHGAREALSISVDAADPSDTSAIHDGRQGELYIFGRDYAAGGGALRFDIERPNNAAADAVDHVIISGHNLNLSEINVVTLPTVVDLMDPNYSVTEANGVPIILPLTATQTVLPDHETIRVHFIQGGAAGSVVPELTELFLTTKHTMTRGPDPGWVHPWLRTQRQFVNDAGVTSTWLKGPARKRFRLTWRGLQGADRQIFFDLQAQTNDWSEPFWFQPPDDVYDTMLMELERDGDWTQDFLDPLTSGTTDEVTLPLIEVLG